jgi:two-component system CheB/CheR fusion protein
MLGPAETTGPQGPFAVVDKKWRLFRKSAADITTLPLSVPTDLHQGPYAPPAPGRPRHPIESTSVQDEATRLILDRFGPPGVVVDSSLQIVQFRGHTGPYLEAATGEPNLGILKMARGGLLHPLRTLLQQAKRRSRVVRKEGVHIQRNGDWAEIALEVAPLNTARGEHYLVLFDEAAEGRRGGRRRKAPAPRPTPPPRREADGRVADLRRELAASREYLQSIIQELEAANEELQSANEEILSSNEELQSTNEELDTAKEELQSTNEELNTVNEELHSRNEELTRVNSDLTNLLGSVEIPIVIVGSDMGIRRFTPRAEQLFNLIPGDVGRPIGQINPNFTIDNLERLIHETVDSVSPRERDVQDKAGRWLSLRIRPYKGIDNRLDGAVLSIVDIDATRRHQTFVEQSRDHFRGIVDAVRQPIVVVDAAGKVTSANRMFYETYNIRPGTAEGRELGWIGDGRWNQPAIAEIVDSVRKNGKATERMLDHDVPNAGRRKVRVTAGPLRLDDTQTGTVIMIEDVGHADQAT